jgi:hypothetical protein
MAAMRPTALKRSLNRAKSDMRITGRAVKAVGGAPLSVYRKITGGSKNTIKNNGE